VEPDVHPLDAAEIEQHTRERDADERDHVRPPAPDLVAQRPEPADELVGPQRIDARRLSRDEIGDPVAPLRQPHVVFGADWFRDEPRFVK